MKKLIGLLFTCLTVYLVLTTSCANVGTPTGGPKDTIPPRIIFTTPAFNAVNYSKGQVVLTFNEYIKSDNISSDLVVSPPIKKSAEIKMKSKTLYVDLGDSLKSNTTYCLNFGDGIEDNNEGNPLKNFRFAFSTGPVLDSLVVAGYVKMAEDMEGASDVYVFLYRQSRGRDAFKKEKPDYLSKTDENGFYRITNVAPGKYYLVALDDKDNSLSFNQPSENLAFSDSLVTAQNPVIPKIYQDDADSLLGQVSDSIKAIMRDSIARAVSDTLVGKLGMVADSLGPQKKDFIQAHYLLMFTTNYFNQYLDSYARPAANLTEFYFSQPVSDSLQIKIYKPKLTGKNQTYLEYNSTRDSLLFWINDTTISSVDTLSFIVKYLTPDSLGNPAVRIDSLDMVFAKKVSSGRSRKKKEKDRKPERENETDSLKAKVPRQPEVVLFNWIHNLKDDFDVYKSVKLESPVPLEHFDQTKVHLFMIDDTIPKPVQFKISPDSLSPRKFRIAYPWTYSDTYELKIDSAAASAYDGSPSALFDRKFKIKSERYYGKIILLISNLPGPCFLQLLTDDDKERLIRQVPVSTKGNTAFEYLDPGKYKIRLIVDRNNNGKWDTGDFDKNIQPERVVYYPKILKIRSNFIVKEQWELPNNLQFKKDLIDEDQQQKDAFNKGSKRKKR